MNETTPNSAPESPRRFERLASIAGPALTVCVALFLVFPLLNPNGAVETWVTQTALRAIEKATGRTMSVTGVRVEDGVAIVEGVVVGSSTGRPVFEAERVHLSFDGLPMPGGPLRLRTIELFSPTVTVDTRPAPSEPGQPAPAPHDSGFALSDFLVMRSASVVNGRVVVLASDSEPVEIENISFDMTFDPATDTQDRSQYAYAIDLGREPGFSATLDGVFDADALVLQVDEGSIKLDASEHTRDSLPGPLRTFAEDHEIEGGATLAFGGTIPLRSWSEGAFDAELLLSDIRVAAGDSRLPIDEARIGAVLADGELRTDGCNIRTAGGTVTLHASWRPGDDGAPMQARWQVESLDLETFLRTSAAAGAIKSDAPPAANALERGAEQISHAARALGDAVLPGEGKSDKDIDQPPVAGLLTTQGSVSFDTDNVAGTASGSGSAYIREGWLVKVPIVTQLNQVAGAVGAGSARTHELDSTFEIVPGACELEIQRLRTTAVGARGEGSVGFDGALRLDLRAGPLERLRILTGAVGDAVSTVTDEVFPTYKVRGTLAEPTVSLLESGEGDG